MGKGSRHPLASARSTRGLLGLLWVGPLLASMGLGACGQVEFTLNSLVADGGNGGNDGGDTPPADASTDGGWTPSGLCHQWGATALACWDFEDPDQVLPQHPNGTATRDLTRAHEGQASMLSTVSGSGITALALTKNLDAPLTSGKLFMRGFFFVPSNVTFNNWVVAMETKSGSAKISMDFVSNNGVQLAAVGSNFNYTSLLGNVLPRDRWFCAEMEIDIHPSTGWVRLSIDGQLTLQLNNTNTTLGGGLDSLRLGPVTGSGTHDFLYNSDGFLARQNAIGCDGP